jgi:hypothetical protein
MNKRSNDTSDAQFAPQGHGGILRDFLAVSVTLVTFGCASEPLTRPGVFGDTPAAVEFSNDRLFEVALYSSPTRTPTRGDNHVRIDLVHSNSDAVSVTPDLSTFMPAMGHGSGISPKLTEVSAETYTFEDVVLNMPGRWQLQLELETELDDGSSRLDHATFEFDVD